MGRLLFFVVIIFLGTLSSAALKSVKNEIVYSEKTQLYWVKDANLLRTMSRQNPHLIAEIITSVPKGIIRTRPTEWEKGRHELSERDFGLVFNSHQVWYDSTTWWGALAFIHYLNKINYGGYNDWRLPKIRPRRGNTLNYNFAIDGSTELGFNITDRHSELSHLYYSELKNKGQYKDYPAESLNPPKPGALRKGPFLQLKGGGFWYSNEFEQGARLAWIFAFDTGFQSGDQKEQLYIPWPVRSDHD